MNNRTKSKTAIIGTVGVPASYGGFETLVENLLDSENTKFIVYCSSKSYTTKFKNYKKAQLVYIPLCANGISSIFYDIISILHSICIKKADSLLILGVSGCMILPLIKKISSAKICTNIDGLEWRRDKWGKLAKRFLKFSEKIAVRYSDVIIADNREIANYVFMEYKVTSRVIAYGGDHALIKKEKANKFKSHIEPYYLSLCRIEPENNIHLILEAFVNSDKKLKFIGNWNNSEYGKRLKDKYSCFPNIAILDPIYDIEKLSRLRWGCSAYIHGHSAGGTNPSLVEMMFFAKPIICFDCEYNRYTTHNKSSYFKTSSELFSKIEEANYGEQGHQLKLIAEQFYTWDKIRQQYEQILSV